MQCPYCSKILFNTRKNSGHLDKVNEILFFGPSVVITPTLGTFIEGHLLAVSIEHLSSMACLPEQNILRLYSFLRSFVNRLSDTYGPYCIFEHGVGVKDKRKGRGQSIDHAHFHLIPISGDINKFILTRLAWERLDNIGEIKRHANEGYLFYSFDDRAYICANTEVESQWIRKIVFQHKHENQKKHWDWRKYEGLDEIGRSSEIVKSILSQKIARSGKDTYEIVLVRHGEPDYSAVDKNYINPIDKNYVPLADRGTSGLYVLAEKLRSENATLLISSPYVRALQTAAILNQTLSLPLRIEFGLREWSPDIHGNEISLAEHERRRDELIRTFREPGLDEMIAWESRASVYKRAHSAIKKYQNLRKVIAITHAIVIGILTGSDPNQYGFGDIARLHLSDRPTK